MWGSEVQAEGCRVQGERFRMKGSDFTGWDAGWGEVQVRSVEI